MNSKVAEKRKALMRKKRALLSERKTAEAFKVQMQIEKLYKQLGGKR